LQRPQHCCAQFASQLSLSEYPLIDNVQFCPKKYLVQGETAQAMLDGTARSADLLPVTDWAVLFCSPAASPATSMPGSPEITSSAAASAAQSGTPTAAPAALEAACQAAASPADSTIALPGPSSVAQSARSAEKEDVDEHQEGLEWLFGPTQPQQQECVAAAVSS